MTPDFIWDFINKYFIVPGYDIVDTPTYGIILGIAVLFGVIPLLRKLDVKIDRKFILAVVPFILFGSSARELVDRGLGVYGLLGPYPQNYFMVSPGIYATIFLLALGCLLAGLLFERLTGRGYHLFMGSVGSILFLYNLLLIIFNVRGLNAFLAVLAVFVFTAVVVFYFTRFEMLRFLLQESNFMIVLAHLLDASATFVGVDFLGYGEQHVLPNFLIEYFGTAFVMFPLKMVFLLPALYLIERDVSGDELSRRLIKLVLFILGAGPAIRDVTLIILG